MNDMIIHLVEVTYGYWRPTLNLFLYVTIHNNYLCIIIGHLNNVKYYIRNFSHPY